MNNQIELKLKELVMKGSRLKIDMEDVNNESDIIDDFGYDSISVLGLIVAIEKEFSIEFEDDELSLQKVGKFGYLNEYVINKVKLKS